MEKRGYTIDNVYQGGYSSFSPTYGDVFSGYRTNASEIGAHTKPDTANQLQSINLLLNQGIVPIEMTVLSPETFDQIPRQHFKEINRMSKLTGAKMSVHAPIIEPSGVTDQGWSEANRELAEKQLIDVVSKSVDMDPTGGMPVTVHSSGIPGSEYKMTKEGKKMQKMIVINQESGKMAPLEEEKKYYPGSENLAKGTIKDPQEELSALNYSEWNNALSQIVYYKEGADRILNENMVLIRHLFEDLEKGKLDPKNLLGPQKEAFGHVQNAKVYLDNTHQYINGLFHKAYKFGTDDEKRLLEQFSKQFAEELKGSSDPMKQSIALQNLMVNLREVTPKTYIPVEDFAVKNASETFANVAFKTYDKHKSKSPTISIENLYPGMAFSMGKDMSNLITESRRKFVEKAVEKGYSKSEAEQQAKKMIGMTLDVGHLNIAKKRGFKDADLAKEVAEIAKYVKHVHMTDNFGYSDSHLPPGMGNVPIKAIMEELDKQNFEGTKIVEAGAFVQQFGTSPFPISLEAMGSPIYETSQSPYWNQALGLQQSYFAGRGDFLPQINYEMSGAGFSQLPAELGGQRGGGGSRMGGRPME